MDNGIGLSLIKRYIANRAGLQRTFQNDLFTQLTRNALTDSTIDIVQQDGQLPSTFVPGRNHLFFLCTNARVPAGISHIVTGVCQTDYSGYPDCRDEFVVSLNQTLNLAMDYNFTLHTPLMWLNKAETVTLMRNLGHLDWLADSYLLGKRPACGVCPACVLRLKGFDDAGSDPLAYERC